PLPTGVVEGRGQGVHREDRLSHPGRTDAVNPVLVNRYSNGFIVEGQRKEHVLTPSGWSDVVLLGKIKTQKQ
ncbi:hypothetical protein, partial [Aeromonas caviae]|uniref:hypothetical protein n=1 Tax=Aeromonas caviae TaxID=648 RepID=UPI001FC8AF23